MGLLAWKERAAAALPAGGFGNFDPNMIIQRGEGSRVWDEDGNEYLDLLIGSGPMLLGHGNEEVLDAVRSQLDTGLTYFANNAAGIELAEEIIRGVPSAESVRYVSTGGEADMYAMRLARAYTGRDLILKFEGGYHGMCAEAQMSLAPTTLTNFPLAVPDSAGIPDSVRDGMLIAPFNDAAFVRSLVAEYEGQIAAIIVEPLQRVIPPEPGFLSALREIADAAGIVLIFDEVVTGFRFDYGGAQVLYSVTPDISTLGKIIGGGFPLAAISGRKEIMAHFDKAQVGAEGFLMQLGTLSGNPVASVAGLKTMEILRRDGQYQKLRALGETMQQMFSEPLQRAGIAHQIVGDATLFDVVFTGEKVVDYRSWLKADAVINAKFNQALRQKGILKSPGKCYPSLAISDDDLHHLSDAIAYAVAAISV